MHKQDGEPDGCGAGLGTHLALVASRIRLAGEVSCEGGALTIGIIIRLDQSNQPSCIGSPCLAAASAPNGAGRLLAAHLFARNMQHHI
jgi:hypothetical protein